MIIFAEINKTGESHIAVNVAMLEILYKQVGCSQVKIFSEKNHVLYLKNKNKAIENIDIKVIPVIEGRFFVWPLKVLLEFLALIKIFSEARNSKAKFVFISSIFSLSHLSFLIVRPFFKKIKVVIGIHGELQLIKSKSFKNKLLSFFLKLNLKKTSDSKTYFLVYSEMIKNNLCDTIPKIKNKIISIDHPYSYSNKDLIPKVIKPIQIGSIGVASKSKNTHLIFHLANALKKNINNGNVKFKVLGKSIPDILPYKNQYVDYNYIKSMIPEGEYQKQIESLSYLIFFYGNDLYSLSPSGVFFDAINNEKPIIALKSDLFNYYFNRFGNIGFLCDDIEEMIELIGVLSTNFSNQKYNLQIANIRKAKKCLDINIIKKTFWDTLNQLT